MHGDDAVATPARPGDPAGQAQEEVARLTAAARTVLARGGYWGFKVESVLRQAGLSTRSFYRHFEGKDQLLLRLLQEDVHRTAGRLWSLTRNGEPTARVLAWVTGILDMAYVERVAKPTTLFATHWHQLLETFPQQVEQCRTELVAPLVEALTALSETGKAPLVRPEQDARAMFSLVATTAAETITRHGVPARPVVEAEVLPFLSRALGVELGAAAHVASGDGG